MEKVIKYVVQLEDQFFGGWIDEKFSATLEDAKINVKKYKYERFVRVVKRITAEEEILVHENAPPKPKFKVGDLVRPKHTSKKEYPSLVGKITGVVEGSYWIDGRRWNYNLDWNDQNFPNWNGCREYELVRTSLPF